MPEGSGLRLPLRELRQTHPLETPGFPFAFAFSFSHLHSSVAASLVPLHLSRSRPFALLQCKKTSCDHRVPSYHFSPSCPPFPVLSAFPSLVRLSQSGPPFPVSPAMGRVRTTTVRARTATATTAQARAATTGRAGASNAARVHPTTAQPPTTPDDQSFFACPFYRRHPGTYARCRRRNFKRVRDMKPHLYEHHLRPEHYCPTCGDQSFANEADLNRHLDEKQCEAPPEGVMVDGIDACQRAQIEKLSQRGQGDVETWRRFWAILFPGVPCHASPIFGDMFEVGEVLGSIKAHWGDRGQGVMGEAAAAHGLADELGRLAPLIEDVVERLFSEFLGIRAVADGGAADGAAVDSVAVDGPTAPAFSLNLAAGGAVSFSGMHEAANAFNNPSSQVDGDDLRLFPGLQHSTVDPRHIMLAPSGDPNVLASPSTAFFNPNFRNDGSNFDDFIDPLLRQF